MSTGESKEISGTEERAAHVRAPFRTPQATHPNSQHNNTTTTTTTTTTLTIE